LVRHRPCPGSPGDLLGGHFGGCEVDRVEIGPGRGCILRLRKMRPDASVGFTLSGVLSAWFLCRF